MTYTSLRTPRASLLTAAIAVGLLASPACGGDVGTPDAGRDTGGGGGPDAFVPGEMDAFCMVECAAPPVGCRWEPVAGECSCGTLVCEDAGVLEDPDAYVAPGTDAASRPDVYVPPGADADGLCVGNDECTDREWCSSASCGGAGSCMARPMACPRVYDPVCGCDGMTYSNECAANSAGQNVATRGECPTTACTTNDECGRSQWCAGETCGAPGACEDRPTACPDLYAPVCGCDGTTYSNDCDAASNGMRVSYRGECSTTGSCRTNDECPRDQYCNGVGCDTPGTCVTRGGGICPGIYAPVCGCDGTTYGNACEAAAAGARVARDGECGSSTDMCTPPCAADQTCQLCRGPGGGVYVCLPRGAVC